MDDIRKPSADLIILTALAAEAKTLIGRKKNSDNTNMFSLEQRVPENSTISVVQCGIGCDALLAVAASQLKDSSIVGSIGVSGGLAPDLIPGTVILGDRIVIDQKNNTTFQETYLPNAKLLDALELVLRKSGLPYRRGTLLCTKQPLDTVEKKATAYLKTGALAVDMESAGAAEASRQKGASFFCIRIICDPAGRKIEKDLLAGVDSQGNNSPLQLIRPLIRRPWLLAPLLIMARDFTLALAGMRRVWNVVQKPLVDFACSHSTARAPDRDL